MYTEFRIRNTGFRKLKSGRGVYDRFVSDADRV